jgi:ribosome biogenesis protein ENP2
LVPAVGVNQDGNGEVFRLNLEVGRFMKGFEIDVGGDDFDSLGGGALQGGIRAGSVNCAAVADESHGLLAFGTSAGTVEFWDSRSRNRVSAFAPPPAASMLDTGQDLSRSQITALEFHPSGLNLATGDSNGIIQTYDLRSPIPLLQKDQGYGSPIQTLRYLNPLQSRSAVSSNKLLSADRKSIKLFDSETGDLWTSIEPAVDLNCVEWVPDSGMLLTANEGRQQHSFFIPQLGPAPKWCGFLDNLVEEMAEDGDADPNAFNAAKSSVGEVYDNYKFVDQKELRELNLDHLVGTTNVLRPYMHGFFVPQRLYEQARLLANPDLAFEQRQKSIQEKIDKERESRIRGNKKVAVKVNRKLAEKLAAREEANERRKAQRLLRKRGEAVDEEKSEEQIDDDTVAKPAKKSTTDLMDDDRFKRLFQDEDFEIDEMSREYQLHNPSSALNGTNGELKKRGLTAVEDEEMDEVRDSSEGKSEDEDDEDAEAEVAALRARQRRPQEDEYNDRSKGRIGNASYKKSGHQSRKQREQKPGPMMQVSSSNKQAIDRQRARQTKSFGDLASSLKSRGSNASGERRGDVVGEKEVTFAPSKPAKKQQRSNEDADAGRSAPRGGREKKERRSASGNTFRRM